MIRTGIVLVSTLWLWLLTRLAAQTNRGGISGTIYDASGAPIPRATVRIANVGTNQTVTLTASADGNYDATLLEPVTYRITVEAPGFSRAVLEAVKVNTSAVTTANITLQVGAVTAQVTVTAEAAQVNAENGSIGEIVTERQITDIPLGDRSVLNLTTIAGPPARSSSRTTGE